MDYRPIIESKYNRENWQKLLHDIFGNKIKFWNTPSTITTSSQFAKQALWLGTITLSDNQTISIYEVELSDSVDIERNRRGIRDMLLTDWRNNGNAGAFMFCYRKKESVLRFSYVSEAWTFADDGSYQKESTDAKRFTYLLGEGHRSRTAIQQFEKLRDSSLTLKDLTNAFDVEAINEEFFEKYKAQYILFVNYMKDSAHGMRDVFIDTDFDHTGMTQKEIREREEKPIRDYVKKLLGRIVFLHFLQKKGWMGVPSGKNWGDGDRDFMLHLFQQATKEQQENYLDDILEDLFSEGLDRNRIDNNDEYDTEVDGFRKCRIPYLNGGLFERDNQDKKPCKFPSHYFRDLLTMFSQYNFTIDENDPNDAEVGVDPEMLGRIFENLLEDNKDKGAYYTPKEIVQYMCRESLISYLQTGYTSENKDRIRRFVFTHDANHLGNIAYDIDTKLCNVKICDPAIGSGAFPMGLLRELFLCRLAIEPDIENNAGIIKRQIIQQNIYGVDIERGAVDIARLRFWLSLVVDELTPEALPNLDFKIMQGNSLMEQYKNVDLSHLLSQKIETDHNSGIQLTWFETDLDIIRNRLYSKMADYYSCVSHNDRAIIRKDIASIIQEQIAAQQIPLSIKDVDIHANQHFFLWHTWFHDVFSQGGFDIVIGNPPYGAKLSNEEKTCYKKNYITAKYITGVQKASLDSFTLFIELGYNLLKTNGCFAYIVPISLTSSDSMSGVHRIMMKNCEPIYISSYAVRPKPVFKNAVVNTSILLFQKTGVQSQHLFATKMYRRGAQFNLQQLVDNLQFTNVKDYVLFGRIPKIGTEIEKSILSKLFKHDKLVLKIKKFGYPIVYRFAGGRYFKVVTNYSCGSSAERTIYFSNESYANAIGCILSSNLSFWFYQIYSDNLNWKNYEIENFTVPSLSDKDISELNSIYNRYLEDIEKNANVRITTGNSSYNVGTFKEYKIVRSKHIIDEIDDYICPLYGLTEDEKNFVKKYELAFRLAGE